MHEEIPEPLHFCPKHGGATLHHQKKRAYAAYQLDAWAGRIEAFAEDSKATSLRGEIGILRVLVEETLKQCPDQRALMMHAPRLSDLVMRLEKLVSSCERIETKLGLNLSESQSVEFANRVIDIFQEFVKEPETVDKMSQKLISELEKLHEAD